MCCEAGIPPRTNQSLQATGATTLLCSCVPENIIQKTTGHRSLDGLRIYKHPSAEQHQAVSRVMKSTKETSFQDQLAEMRNTVPEQQCQATSTTVCENKLLVISDACGHSIGRLLGDITNCTIGKLTINVNPTFNQQCSVEEQFL